MGREKSRGRPRQFHRGRQRLAIADRKTETEGAIENRKSKIENRMLPLNKTKIVATIGPASNTPPVLEQMIHAGMDVARLNFSHGDFEVHRQNIQTIRAASAAAGRPVAIMADLPGPKIRLGRLSVEKIQLQAGDRFIL